MSPTHQKKQYKKNLYPLLTPYGKKTKIYDGNNLVKFYSTSDIIDYFTKYGYEYEGSSTGGSSTNYQTKQTYIRTVMMFKKVD